MMKVRSLCSAVVDGIHDMGGMHGFGAVPVEVNEPVFHAPWESRVLGMVYQVVGAGWSNVDTFRHAIERLAPATYLGAGYYGRWLRALETVLVEAGLLGRGEVEARIAGAPARVAAAPSTGRRYGGSVGVVRSIDSPPRFTVGDHVVARNVHPPGHTRLPRYVRGKQGVVHRVHPACVFPDTHAHGLGEDAQHVYGVRFTARELWGPDAEPGNAVHLDLFERYLEPSGGAP